MKKQILKISISAASVIILSLFVMPHFALAISVNTDNPTNITDTTATLNGDYDVDAKQSHSSKFILVFPDGGRNDECTADRRKTSLGDPFTCNIDGLVPSSTYGYKSCVYKADAGGWNCGGLIAFSTNPAVVAPTNVTASSSNVGGYDVRLNGTWSSNGTGVTAWFDYGETNSFGSSTNHQNLGASGSTNQYVSSLKLNTTYYFRFVAQDRSGNGTTHTTYSQTGQFTTLSSEPIVLGDSGYYPTTWVDTLGAKNITGTTAALQGTADADAKENTTAYFRYATMYPPPVFCNDIYGSNMMSTGDINIGADPTNTSGGNGAVQVFSKTASGLTPNTQYYYCALASSKSGISYSQHLYYFFTNGTSITTDPATNTGGDSATLNGEYNNSSCASYQNNTCVTASATTMPTWFEYAKTSAAVSGGTGTVVGTQTQTADSYGDIRVHLTNLDLDTTYYFRAGAKKSDGTEIYGAIQSFQTGASSDSNPCPATPPNNNTNIVSLPNAPINGKLGNSNLLPISPPFSGPIGEIIGGLNFIGIPVPINSLNLPTNPCAPIITTYTASNINPADATIIGTWDADGSATKTWFDWGATASLGTSTLPVAQGVGAGVASENISGLTDGTTYYFRTVGQNSQGTTYGQILAFVAGGNNLGPVGPTPGGGTYPNGGGIYPNTGGGGNSSPTTNNIVTAGEPPTDAIVRVGEGVESVFIRQIEDNPAIATLFGYQGNDLTSYADTLAHTLATIFGYVEDGKEIRVSLPDLAAYELKIGSDNSLIVNEYFAGFLISSRKVMPGLKAPPSGYEYKYVKL